MRCTTIGIAGGTGSGKSTLAQALHEAIQPSPLKIAEDSYYLDQSHLGMAERALVNYDHPDSLELDLLCEHLSELRRGRSVDAPQYDFATHSRKGETLRIAPAEVVLVEGILVLSHAATREVLDLKVYVDTPAKTRLARRVRRDIEERGRQEQAVREQFERTAQPMHEAFVAPSRAHADLVVDGTAPIADLVQEVFAAARSRLGSAL